VLQLLTGGEHLCPEVAEPDREHCTPSFGGLEAFDQASEVVDGIGSLRDRPDQQLEDPGGPVSTKDPVCADGTTLACRPERVLTEAKEERKEAEELLRRVDLAGDHLVETPSGVPAELGAYDSGSPCGCRSVAGGQLQDDEGRDVGDREGVERCVNLVPPLNGARPGGRQQPERERAVRW